MCFLCAQLACYNCGILLSDVTKSGEDVQPPSEGQLPQEGTGEGTETAQETETAQGQGEG